VPFILFTLVGLGFFYLQNLVFFPNIRLRLLALLIFFVALRPPLALGIAVGLALGLLQDSYAATPFGLHLGASLVVVAAARFLRSRLLLQRLGSLVLASLAALLVQEAVWQVIMLVLRGPGFLTPGLLKYHSLEILWSLALSPLMAILVNGLESALRRWGWRPPREARDLA
jgi:rod shape-determining protein MreD